MSTRRITISMPADVAARIERAAGSGSVSAWMSAAARRTLAEDDARARFLAFCDDVPASRAEETRAKASFDRITRGAKAGRSKNGARGKTAA